MFKEPTSIYSLSKDQWIELFEMYLNKAVPAPIIDPELPPESIESNAILHYAILCYQAEFLLERFSDGNLDSYSDSELISFSHSKLHQIKKVVIATASSLIKGESEINASNVSYDAVRSKNPLFKEFREIDKDYFKKFPNSISLKEELGYIQPSHH